MARLILTFPSRTRSIRTSATMVLHTRVRESSSTPDFFCTFSKAHKHYWWAFFVLEKLRMTGQLLSLETGNYIKIFAFYLTLRSLVSPGKSSPVIRRGLFLTGDQSHDGGKGGAVKNRGAKRPFNCAAQLRCACSRHGGILFNGG